MLWIKLPDLINWKQSLRPDTCPPKKYLKNKYPWAYFSRFHGISEKELELSQYGKFINTGYKTKRYEVAMCDFHHPN